MKRLEFRSDTMTLPTQAMRDAMRDAIVGDDVCGEDPTANRLESMAAEILGKEAALFVPSGTFGNQCAIRVHTKPGDEVIVSEHSHIVDHEVGAAAAISGVQLRTIQPIAPNDFVTADQIARRIRTIDDIHQPDTGLILLENALALGTVMPLPAMQEVQTLARKHQIPVHLDGARIFNAALALKVPAATIAACVDSVQFCLSKGLGAPAGSLLCGTRAFIARARKIRKMMGGGMRQIGVLAAPGLLALTDGVARLHEDHANATLLARLLSEVPGIHVDPARVQINMVFCHVERAGKHEQGLVDFLKTRNILVYDPEWWGVRFAVSREVCEEDVRSAAHAVSDYMMS